jgi:hypothetical protein
VRIASHAAAKDTPRHSTPYHIPATYRIPACWFFNVTSVSRLLAGCIRFDARRRHLRRGALARQRELRRARCGKIFKTNIGAFLNILLNDQFAKTGSGQTWEKLRAGVFCAGARVGAGKYSYAVNPFAVPGKDIFALLAQVRTRYFLSVSTLNIIILPSQARDKRRESTLKRVVRFRAAQD